MGRTYIAIDLKSFYASVECVERGLDPLDTLLVVADESRTSKTICLAVSPALKAYGTGGRPRLFEVESVVRKVNAGRRGADKSHSARELASNPTLCVDYIVAPPRMAHYIDYSTRIFNGYLRHIAPEDIHVYSIDEVFIDATDYLRLYKLTAHDLAMKLIREVLKETGVTATAGIGTNLYLCKVAMDIVAKKMPADKDGVRVAQLDEGSYRRQLWPHQPLTDFWRVGRATADKLRRYGVFTMGDLARFSLHHQDFLFEMFGVNAELLIDHAWGVEPVTIADIKAYRPETHSLSSGQVLQRPYSAAEARNVVLEMADALALELVEKGLVTDQVVLDVGYDTSSAEVAALAEHELKSDRYGRKVPNHAHGSQRLDTPCSSGRAICRAVAEIFDRVTDSRLTVRRLNVTAAHVAPRGMHKLQDKPRAVQLDLFADPEELQRTEAERRMSEEKEQRTQSAILSIKKKFGKNAILKGLNFAEGATQRERNSQIGGHKA